MGPSPRMQRMQSSVDALRQAQASVLALGQAMGARMQAHDQNIVDNSYIEIVNSGLVSSTPLYTEANLSTPTSDVLTIAKAGDVLVQSMTGFYSDCIIPMVEHTGKQIGGWNFKIVPGEPACKMKAKDSGYTPTYFNAGNEKGKFDFIYALSTKAKDNRRSLCFRKMGYEFSCKKELADGDLIFAKGFVANTKSLSDVLVLSAINGDKAEISYFAGPVNNGRRAGSPQTTTVGKGANTEVGPYRVQVIDLSAINLVAKIDRVK